MSDQVSLKRIHGIESSWHHPWPSSFLRGRGAMWLILAMVTGGLAVSSLLAQDPAPINRRFEVHRTAGGFELLGFRAEVGSGERFALYAGMSADQARLQMLSVGWGASYGLRDLASRELWGSRVRYQDVVETVAVILDPAGRTVQTVAYEWQLARFSRFGLGYYLNAAFGEGRPLVDDSDRVVMEYGPRGGQTLRVEATRAPAGVPSWRIVFRVDVAAGSAGE